MPRDYDRSAEDIGNIVGLEHVNVRVPDQRLATLFYVSGLGLTRDPYLVTGVINMWINVGRSQFHLPTGEAQRLRGRTGLVLSDLDALAQRLAAVRDPLSDTEFGYETNNDRFGPITLGMAYVELDVPVGAANGIARFYNQLLNAPVRLGEVDGAAAAFVAAGHRQSLVFRETDAVQPAYDGHHLQIYVADFSGPHEKLNERGLVSEESNQHQYRFQNIVDPDNGDLLFELEHEVRSMTHPLYARPLVNRNPAQTNNAFAPGHEEWPWAMPYGS